MLYQKMLFAGLRILSGNEQENNYKSKFHAYRLGLHGPGLLDISYASRGQSGQSGRNGK